MTIPRLYVNFSPTDTMVSLTLPQMHYLKNVLRVKEQSCVTIFCEAAGEWLAHVTFVKKQDIVLMLHDKMKNYDPSPFLALAFAPLKQDETRLVIEKATELGVTDFYPIQTQFSQTHRLSEEKLHTVMIKASEQCERLDIPTLHPMRPLRDLLTHQDHQFYAALERSTQARLSSFSQKSCFIIGPEGGFSKGEHLFLSTHPKICGVTLGQNILRAETAAIAALSIYRWSVQ